MQSVFLSIYLTFLSAAQPSSVVLRILYMAGGTVQTAARPASADSANVQTGVADPGAAKDKQLIDQMIQALGREAYLRFTDVAQEGRTSGFDQGTPTGVIAPFA